MAAEALSSMERYAATRRRPNAVTRAPPPRAPPAAVVTTRSRKSWLSASTSCHARRYDMPMARAAAEIEPVLAMRSISSALPGPIAGRRLPSTRSVSPRYLLAGIREEKLLAADLIGSDGGLSLGRDQPVDERLALRLFYMRMLRRVDQHRAVLVEQAPVALDHDPELAAVLEREPGGAVGERIGVHPRRCIERRPHARAGLAVPRPLRGGDVHARRLPQLDLGEVGAALVAAGRKRRLCVMNSLESERDILAAGDLCWIGPRTHQHEIVVHHLEAPHAVALGDELFLQRPGVHEDHVGIAAPAHVERLPGAERHHAHLHAALLFVDWQQVPEQSGLLGRRGRCDRDVRLLRLRRKHEKEAEDAGHHAHGNSPLTNAAASGDAGCGKNRSIGARSATRPWCRKITSSPRRRAWPRLWVDITILVPAASKALIRVSISRVAPGSRFAVGSSRNSTSGCNAHARANATRCCSPPERTRAGRCATCARPTSFSASMAIFSACAVPETSSA